MLSLPRRKYPAMIEVKEREPLEELLSCLGQVNSRLSDETTIELLRLLADVPGDLLPILAAQLPDRFAWLVLYHPHTRPAETIRGLECLPYQDVHCRHLMTASITPSMIEEVSRGIRALVLGRLMLAVLNHQVPLTVLPDDGDLHRYLDDFLCVPGHRHVSVELWDALYALSRAIQLWRFTGFHPRQWECQTVIASLPSQESGALLRYAHDIWSWARADHDRQRFADQFWGLTLKYFGASDAPHLGLPELCALIETALELAPPFLAVVQPDPEALEYVTVDDFDKLFQTVSL